MIPCRTRSTTCTTDSSFSDVAFGEPFGALENSENHPYISAIFQMFKFLPIYQGIHHFGLAPFVKYVTPKKRIEGWSDVQKFCAGVIGRRLEKPDTDDRKDFTYFMRQVRKGYKLSQSELQSESNTLVVAGSETSATALAGAFYFLLSHPEVCLLCFVRRKKLLLRLETVLGSWITCACLVLALEHPADRSNPGISYRLP